MVRLCLSAVLACGLTLSVCAVERELTADVFRTDGTASHLRWAVRQEGSRAVFRIPAETIGAGSTSVVFRASFATAHKGEKGYFVLCDGLVGGFREERGRLTVDRNCHYMPFFGMKTPRDTFVLIAKKMQWRYIDQVVVEKGVYSVLHRYELNGDRPYEDFEFEYTFLGPDADYPDMAKVYRDWKLSAGLVRPIRERMRDYPELGVAATNIEVRIRQAWKPVPSPVPYQTRLNEPPVHAAVTFDRCADIVREMKRQGISHAEMCLVGWNRGGHDGAYPQLFPVEPVLGGEARLRTFIDYSNSVGYQTVCHTCFYSAYVIADDFDEEYLLKEKDGSLQPSHLNWGGGRPYRTCPQRAYEKWTKKNMQLMKDLGFHGLHYHDVYSILPPRICYDPRHPCDPNDSIRWYVRQMEETRDLIGGTQSEGPFDHYAGNLDFCMYGYFYPLEKDDYVKKRKQLADRHVPLFQLVYHGIILSNPFTGTLNYPLKAPHKRLKFIEFGGRPLFVWYANFLTGKGNWMGKEDLTCATDEELKRSVAAIRRGYDEFERLAHLQFEYMTDHRVLTPTVTLTAYANGERVLVNHGDTDFTFEGTRIPAGDWVLIR